jgi:hypothetical protein
MSGSVLIGQGREISSIPFQDWHAKLHHIPVNDNPRLVFMTGEHHKIRNFVVKELPRLGKPIPAEHISGEIGVSINRTIEILDELERNLFFLVRNPLGEVLWAFPVTAEKTPHQLLFKSGERLYAA